MTQIKICGLMTRTDIEAVNRATPDFAGFVFAGGRHHVSLDQALELRQYLDPKITSVGVFVNAPISTMLAAVAQGVISMVQLHGNESEDVVRCLQVQSIPVIRVFQLPATKKLKTVADYLMVDSGSGTGKVLDWQHLEIVPDILAGALDSQNLKRAIEIVQPKIVDVSRGVETNGRKDRQKIETIVALAHQL